MNLEKKKNIQLNTLRATQCYPSTFDALRPFNSQLTGEEHAVNNHGSKHQDRIKDVQGPFMSERISLLAHSILHYSENGPNQNQRADRIERVKVFLPRKLGVKSLMGWIMVHPDLEDHGGDYEEDKHHHLHHQTDHDDILTK